MNIIIRPVYLGLFLALSSLSITTPVVSQQVTCETSGECPEESYCATGGVCLAVGKCDEVVDCDNPSNSPYPVALCIGTTICQQGSCGVDCSQAPPEREPAETPAVKCKKSADCPGGRDSDYCATNGFCEPIGGCSIPDDCFNKDNIFPIPACMGGMMCNDRLCEMDCSGGSDAIFMCKTSDDCFEPESYCNTFGNCRKHGSCDIADDCVIFDNTFPMIECVGRQYCENFSCGIACGEVPIDKSPAITCGTSLDCDLDEYCAGNGLCLPPGACDRDADCSNVENSFMSIGCVGTTTCESEMCAKSCDEAETETQLCMTSDDCGMEEYCTGNGICLPNGTCDQVEDCSNQENLFMAVTCVGTLSCDAGWCSKTCDSTPVVDETADNESPVIVDLSSCASDSDCVGLASTRSINDWYCAQGVCMHHGSCQSDTDCFNPSNSNWADKKCFGYLHCTEDGFCDRVCGEDCKNGSIAANCIANPCDVEPMCEEAVSCETSTCDGECKALFFGAAGEVVECGNMDADFAKIEEGSSATIIRSVIPALLAAVLVASVVIV